MAFQYPKAKFEYLRDIGKGTPFTVIHREVRKTVGLKTALLIAELEWGFSGHEHSTTKNAHYGMPRYIMPPKKQNKYIPVLADKCDYSSARVFKEQFSFIGEYYPTLTDYFDTVSTGADPFCGKPYVCIYNRKNHYARFMRNPLNAKRFFVDRLNGKPVLELAKSGSSNAKLQFVHEMLFSSSSNTINNVITIDFNKNTKLINEGSITKKTEVFADNSVVSVDPPSKNTTQVGQGKTVEENTNFTNVGTVSTIGTSGCLPGFEGDCTGVGDEITCNGDFVLVEKKPWAKPPKSASKMGASVSSGELQHCFETKTPHKNLADHAYCFDSTKKAPSLNAGALYSAWAKATLTQYPETLLKPPTGKDFGVCDMIINNAREHFNDPEIFSLFNVCFNAWEKGIIQGVLKTDTVLFTFPARLELTFFLKYQTHFMTWYQSSLKMEAQMKKYAEQKKIAAVNIKDAVDGFVVVKSSLPQKESYIDAVSSAGMTYPKSVLSVYPSVAYKDTMEFRLARAEVGNVGVGIIQQIKDYLAKHAVDLAVSLAKTEEYKVTHAKEL